MFTLKDGKEVSKVWIAEVAQNSAIYMTQVFEKDNANINAVIQTLAQLCAECREVDAYLLLRRYFKMTNHTLPEHYNEMAMNNEAFDLYCRQLVCCLATQ